MPKSYPYSSLIGSPLAYPHFRQSVTGRFDHEAYRWAVAATAAKSAGSTTTEGGEQTTETQYAIRVDQLSSLEFSNYVTSVDDDGGFIRDSSLLDKAQLFPTADAAAAAIARRNAAVPYQPRQYVVVPVKVTTTAALNRVFTTETPAKTVYRLVEVQSGLEVRVVASGGFQWSGQQEPTDFRSKFEAVAAIARRIEHLGYYDAMDIKTVSIPGEPKVERTEIKPSTTTRSL